MNLLNKLTIRNLKLNKKRTVMTVIGIILSVSLITAVSTMFFSAKSSLITFEKQESGDYHYAFSQVEKNDLDMFLKNRKIESNYIVEDLGFSELEGSKNEYKPYANVKAFTEEGLQHLGVQLKEGRLPENSSEILVPSHVKTNGRVEIKLGDKLVFNLGDRMVNGEPISGNAMLSEAGETLVNRETKEFTVVGKIQRLSREIEGHTAAGYTFVTCKALEDMGPIVDVYSRYTKEGMRDQYKVTAALLNVDEEAYSSIYGNTSYMEAEEWEKLVEKMGEPAYDFITNEYILTLENGLFGNPQVNALGTLVVLVICIIIGTSIFCIKNSFDISISEKIRQYGMLSSVGATKKQIKRNVYFEAVVLGAIGIPLGVFAGLFASWVLVYVCNYLIKEMLTFEMTLSISWAVIVFSVLLGAITILLSARKSAVKASKISPIQAIRSSEEIKIRSKKMKAPKWVKRIFGIGGEISYKNLKRSKKKYRTTVVSIVMSVSVFIALYSFVDMAFSYVGAEYKQVDYNIGVSYDTKQISEDDIREVLDLDGIKRYSREMYGAIDLENPRLSKEFAEYDKEMGGSENKEKMPLGVSIMDEASFRAYTKKLKLNYDDVKDKAILYNQTFIYQYDEELERSQEKEIDQFTYKNGDKISVLLSGDGTEKMDLEIAAVTDIMPMGRAYPEVVLGPKYMEKFREDSSRSQIFIDSENADKTQDEIEEIFKNEGDNMLYINNLEENMRMMTSFYTLLAIFLYGFIIVISLIGVTNIFNTITTNMSLRQREFAMLKSVGMTKKEFNRMIRLESFFYGTKSLALGIPLGILLSYMLQSSMDNGNKVLQYVFPLEAIVISAVAVFVLIACIMGYSVRKIRKQNIIETIRNENI